MVSQVLMKRWADGKNMLNEIQVGTGISQRIGPRGLMYEKQFANQKTVSRLEDAWQSKSIERDTGILFADHRGNGPVELAKAIVGDDKGGQQAIRRLLVLHHLRSLEVRLYLEKIVSEGVLEVLQAPEVQEAAFESGRSASLILPWSELERHANVLLDNLATTHKERLASRLIGALPGFFDKAVAIRRQHALQVALAPPESEFILSDTPAYYAGFDGDGQRHFGLTAVGHDAAHSIIMPLTPMHFAYLGPLGPSTDPTPLLSAEQVDELNSHQFGRALRSVVVSPTAPDELKETIRSAVTGRWGYDERGRSRQPPRLDELPNVQPALD